MDAAVTRYSNRLRLEPITALHAHDLWVVHNDDDVAPWYDGWRPSIEEAYRRAESMGHCWRELGVHKWMAYRRDTGELVGRGGLSRTPADDDWSRIDRFLPREPWAQEIDEHASLGPVHARWVEIGWALRRPFWGQGYAAEIGCAGLDFAFDVLGMNAVVSCTACDNVRSRAVMERIGMPYAGTLKGLDGTADLAVHVLLRAAR